MSGVGYNSPQDAGTVSVRVQVIDLEPFSIDMVVPTYLPAKDLTQRVALDAGLGAYWEDGTRRRFYLRARGRLLEDDEKLQDLGVVAHELLHLLPEPPEGSSMEERPPEYPPNRGYAGAGNLNVIGGLVLVIGWTVMWSAVLMVNQGIHVGLFPGLGLSLLCTSFARHLWGGEGSAVRVPITGILVYFPLLLLAAIAPVVLGGVGPASLLMALGPAVIGGMFGVMLGWLAWYGAVEALPEVTAKQVKEAAASVTYPCGICGGAVTQDVKMECLTGCGQVFHEGCYRAKQSLSDGNACPFCMSRGVGV